MKKDMIRVKSEHRCQFIDITTQVVNKLCNLGINDGLITLFVPHTTAGVMINENVDPEVVRDIAMWLERTVPDNLNYQHLEGNSPAHIKSVLIGSSVNIGVVNGEILLGTWQGIFFCEFDGPRTREVYIIS